jgi:hypothetical protein
MSELRSVVDQLRSEVLAELPDARLEEDFSELHRVMDQLESERLRRLAELDRRRTVFERDGHLSAASWLNGAFKLTWGTARDQVRLARALEQMPHARRALEEGELSISALRILAQAREVDPEAFREAEPQLVQSARLHSTGDLQRVASYWRQAAERDHAHDPEDKLHARRRLHVSPTVFGMVRLDGDLDPEGGETLLTALRAVLDAGSRSRGPEDDRSPAQRRADALVELCRQWLDSSERPVVGGERPHLTVTVPVEVLVEASGDGSKAEPARERGLVGAPDRGAGSMAEADHVGPVPVEVVRRLACDAQVRRVVLSGRSEPLDVGRRTPVVSPALRRAVIARDRHCRFGTCDRPASWCDVHHVVPWSEGGPTAIANLILLCRRHHRLVHRPGGFTLELEEGRPVFRRPDGSVLEDVSRAPP